MSKKILKTLSLVCLVSLFSSNIALAEGNLEENSQPEISPLSGTIFTIHGGSGEWGYGWTNLWGKYTHMTKDHRVVLKKDNSDIYGAWELAGATPSYRETSKGNNMSATGQVR